MNIPILLQTVTMLLDIQHPELLNSICWVETKHKNVVNKGDGNSDSFGICQVKLSTANWMRKVYNISGKPLNSKDLMQMHTNALYAGLYVKYQLDRYPDDLKCAISAYNAGKCVSSNKKTYVRKVLNKLDGI